MNKTLGFTLIETLVAITIFGLLTTALFSMIPFLYRIDTYIWHQAYAINEARRGVRVMIREIREARVGEDGSFPIEKATDSEFIFFSNIDEDERVERVRYFLGGGHERTQTKECVSHVSGGSCSVVFSNFYSGTLARAQIQVSVQGDFGWINEYAEISVDGLELGEFCKDHGECNDCSGFWQGTTSFDITDQAQDNFLQFIADASATVGAFCDWRKENHSIKAQFVLSWTEIIPGQGMKFKRGIVEPTGDPVQYLIEQEEITILSRHVQNRAEGLERRIFRYLDTNGQEIIENPARIKEVRLIQFFLIVNVEPGRDPGNYILKSSVRLRNLR